MNNWIKNVHSLLFPRCCTLCGAPGMKHWDICASCYKALPINDLGCTRCAIPMVETSRVGVNTTDRNVNVCGQCLQQPPPYQRCIAAWRYEPPLDYFVQRLKFNKDLAFAHLMAAMFAEYLLNNQETLRLTPDVIIPVPLHKKRLRERGFNQSVEIAREIARRMQIPLDLSSCTRPKLTQPQAELPAGQRQHNIKGAFAFNPTASYQRIVLLDDVMTTGHTINELTKTIQKVSNATIDVWVCARANR